MQLLAPCRHRDELSDALRARLGLSRGVHSEQNRISVLLIESDEELARGRVLLQGRLQIVGHNRISGRVVGRLPSDVLLRSLYFGDSGASHTAARDHLS